MVEYKAILNVVCPNYGGDGKRGVFVYSKTFTSSISEVHAAFMAEYHAKLRNYYNYSIEV